MTKTIIIRLALVATTLTLSACSTQLRSINLGMQVEPEIAAGKVFTTRKAMANVGAVMLNSEEYLKETSAAKHETFHVKNVTTASVKHKLKTFQFTIPAGDYRLRSRATKGDYYSAPKPLYGLDGTNTGYGGLFVPNDTLEATEFYWSWTSGRRSAYQAKLQSTISGSTGRTIVHKNAQQRSGPRATLTYVGVAAGQIRFAYKEFTESGLARAAFTQEVILDYKEGGTYAYKNAQFSVEKADSTHISFTLLKPL